MATSDNLFQSRNRGSFDFKFQPPFASMYSSAKFQSRNRGSFDFKSILEYYREGPTHLVSIS